MMDIPKSNSLTSDAARSPSARNALSMFFDRSIASLSLDALTAQPISDDAFESFLLFQFRYNYFGFLSLFCTKQQQQKIKRHFFLCCCSVIVRNSFVFFSLTNISIAFQWFCGVLVGNIYEHKHTSDDG